MAGEGYVERFATPPSVGPAGDIPPESPEIGARALSVGTRLLCGATTFFFLAFVFAYFYLRSLNQAHMWRPAHIKPDQGLGAAFIACVVISAALSILAARRARAKDEAWRGVAVGALVLGLAAVALQCIEYTRQHFGPTDGAFASVFCAFTGFYLMAVLGTMYWIEVQVAAAAWARRHPDRGEGDIRDPDHLIVPALEAAVFYWAFLAGIGIVMYVTLYLLQA
jgi:heme/copper-type cytochrome/quinol oxidase subunit 3